jgi:hypothetical protein
MSKSGRGLGSATSQAHQPGQQSPFLQLAVCPEEIVRMGFIEEEAGPPS